MISLRSMALLVGLLAAIAVFAGCDGGTENVPPANQAPTISDITKWSADPLAVDSNGIFVVSATDPDGDALQYSLVPSAGEVVVTDSVDYPSVHPEWLEYRSSGITADTTVVLTFTVSDGNGGEDTSTINLDVRVPEAGNSAPSINSFTITPSTIHSGNTATVATNATDADGDSLYINYIYCYDEGAFIGCYFPGQIIELSAGNAQYNAPLVTETKTVSIMVIVDDGHGNCSSATASLTIEP